MKKRTKRKMIGVSALAIVVFGAACIGNSIAKAKAPVSEPVYEPVRIVYEAGNNIANVPCGNTAFKSYMDYRCITDTHSPQYKLQGDCWTDSDGLRRCGDDYVIAVGSYYADCIGDRLEITLENGDEFTAIVGDFKADCHTDSTHRYYPMSGGRKNVVEFIVDTESLDRTARRMGDISYIDGFSGDIAGVEKIDGEVDREI
jgi:hypothetical protein